LLTEGFIAVFQNVAPLGLCGFLVFNFLLTCRPAGTMWIFGIQFSIDLPPRWGYVDLKRGR
jgi:succinate-acetate transporter protein